MRAKTVKVSPPFMLLLLVGANGCRSHSRPAPPPPLPAASQVISSWESPLHVSAEVPAVVVGQRYSAIIDHARFQLHSRKPYQEVEIPLTIRHYHAYVQATWSGRQIECMVDTGSTSIMWPQWQHLDTQQLGFGEIDHGPEGPGVRGEWILSPRIAIGNLSLVNVPTEAMGVPKSVPSRPNFPPTAPGLQGGLTDPILGIFAFERGVMTIDYPHKRLLLRNRDYDILRRPLPAHALLIHYEKSNTGRIVLPGMLGGHQAWFLLDTGCGWVSVSSAFAHNYLMSFPFHPSQKRKSDGLQSTPFIGPLAGDVGGIKFKALDFYVAEHVAEADVWLGAALFWRHRVTIDPFRHMVLVENSR